MGISVIGAEISGSVSAYVLAKAGVNVVLYEKEGYLGGHAKIVNFDGLDIDLGFMVFNQVTYPNMMEFFGSLGVDIEPSNMSFSVSLDEGKGCEWGSRNGFSGLFAQKMNIFNPYFWQMLREIIKFKNDVISYLEVLENNPNVDRNETLGEFIKSRGYSELFQKAYLVPICGSIWSCPTERVMGFSAFSILSFCRNHHLLQLFGWPQWMAVRWCSHHYVNKVREELQRRGCTVLCGDGSQESYKGCIIAVHALDALRLLGNQATYDESRLLGAFQYVYSDIFLHRDQNLMPKNPAAWSAWNFLGSTDNKVCLTYWLNVLQNLGETSPLFLATLNPCYTPKHVLLKWRTGHPIPSIAATRASIELDLIQGKRRIWFCGAYLGERIWKISPSVILDSNLAFLPGYGFLEDGLKAGMVAANGVLQMVCWEKVMTEADLGLAVADAYINRKFSFVDKNDGLLNLVMILIANRDLVSSNSKLSRKRGWLASLLFTAGLTSAKYFFKHVLRQNTLTQSRRSIFRHYDLSNDLFSLFLGETMTYSCAVFKTEDEDLKDAQQRKISLLIEKARIDSKHEVLELGCEARVKEAGLQDNIRFQRCDYRRLPSTYNEMIEGVRHEYLEKFFGCCESLLAEDGLLVLQFVSIPEERHDDYKRSSDLIKEYIFPGECLHSLTRRTSAMSGTSRLWYNALFLSKLYRWQCGARGKHRTSLLPNIQMLKKEFIGEAEHSIVLREILALGCSEKFIRTLEYFFDYCAASFKLNTLGNYQVVFSRPGNVAALGNPYKGFLQHLDSFPLLRRYCAIQSK
ncbi:hypothetical protein DITRI_Ditri15bG0103300 [Diplodiscus trichospermus]